MARILLVDDDQDLCETLQEWLELEGHAVEIVGLGKHALEKLLQSRHDLVILDWQLPDIEGVDVLRAYRNSGGEDSILILSGNRDPDLLAAALNSGANKYLCKPFNLDQFADCLTGMLAVSED